MNTQNKGEIGQLASKWMFAQNGFSILIPIADGLPYDFVAHRPPAEFLRVQAKYKERWRKGNHGDFLRLTKRDRIPKYNKDIIDLLTIYVNETEEMFYVPVESIESINNLTISKSTVDKYKKFPYNTTKTPSS